MTKFYKLIIRNSSPAEKPCGSPAVMTTVGTATNNSFGVVQYGTANELHYLLDKNPDLVETDLEGAEKNAQAGSLSILNEIKLGDGVEEGHGHIATFTPGKDHPLGTVANIGTHNGIMPIGPGPTGQAVFQSKKGISELTFYKLSPDVTPQVDTEAFYRQVGQALSAAFSVGY